MRWIFLTATDGDDVDTGASVVKNPEMAMSHYLLSF